MPPPDAMTAAEARQLEENTRLTQAIHRAIVGEPELGIKGLARRFDDVERRLDTQDERMATWDDSLGKINRKLVWFTGAGAGIFFAWELFKALYLKV